MPHNKNGLLQVPQGAIIKRFGNPIPLADAPSHKRTYQDLFPRPPCQEDAIQGNIGDCYLISALYALLGCPEGPTAIEECMVDRSGGGLSGEVIVRLYDNSAPQYISVSKKVVSGMGAQTVWVKLFEKAYASLFAGESYAKLAEIAGREHGRGGNVFHAILGTKADSFGCNQNDPFFMKLMGLTSNVKGPNSIKQVKDNVFKGDEVLLKAWMEWFTADKAKAWVLTQGHGTVVSRWEDFERFLAGAGSDMPKNVREYILGWIREEGILPGAAARGRILPTKKTSSPKSKTHWQRKSP